ELELATEGVIPRGAQRRVPDSERRLDENLLMHRQGGPPGEVKDEVGDSLDASVDVRLHPDISARLELEGEARGSSESECGFRHLPVQNLQPGGHLRGDEVTKGLERHLHAAAVRDALDPDSGGADARDQLEVDQV